MIRPILNRGDRSSWVVELQVLLNKAHFPIARDGVFGKETDDSVRMFQRENDLVIDGIVGPITWAALDPESQKLENQRRSYSGSGFMELVCRIAQKYEGVREEGGDNRGTHIDRWLADCGITWPAPWCLAYVQACFKEAATLCHFKDPLKPDTAHCLTLWKAAKAKGLTLPPEQGQRGDIAIFDYGGGKGHTGIVVGYKSGYYELMEGNTNDDGSRDGDCVTKKSRYKYNDRLLGFIRIPDPGAEVAS